MDNCCLCGVVTKEIDEVYVECNETKRKINASICDACLITTQANPFLLINCLQAKLDRLDELAI